jgi:4,5-dihydroxyphthalate decarboxylase
MARDLELTLTLADYHRTHPILSGEVSPKGLTLKTRTVVPGEPCLKPIYEEFDIAEMSLSWYVMARAKKEPVIALPVFPQRMFIHPYIFCSSSSNIHHPQDLKGKKVGMDQYRFTVGLWARGILKENYGVSPEEMQWVTSFQEGAGFQLPKQIKLTRQETGVESLLLDGKIDAVIAPNTLTSFKNGDARVGRVFQDCRGEIRDYFDRTKIFPMTHTVVIRESLLAAHPWIAHSLFNAFVEAERVCRKAYNYAKRLAFPTAVLILEEEEKYFGSDPFHHGLTPSNQVVLQKFLGYAEEQGYLSQQPKVSDLFAAVAD